MTKYWFKPKHYGYGFYPISWEGWLALAVLIVLILLSGLINGIAEEDVTMNGIIRFILDAVLLAGLATIFFDKKMEEGLRWRWGRK